MAQFIRILFQLICRTADGMSKLYEFKLPEHRLYQCTKLPCLRADMQIMRNSDMVFIDMVWPHDKWSKNPSFDR